MVDADLRGHARSEPGVRLRIQTDGGTQRLDLGDRLLAMTFEDSDTETDKLTLQLENWDLSFFEQPIIVKGALVEVSFGYPDRSAPVRRMVVKKVKGFTTLDVEAHGRAVLMNREQTCRVFEGVTRSAVARRLAKENGFKGRFVEVEDTQEVFDCINQLGETDARLLKRLARREGFVFYVDQSGLHWHSRRFDPPPTRVYHYFTDPNQGDILSIQLDNDVFAKPGRVRVRSRDPKRKKTVEASGSDTDTQRDTLGEVVEIVDPETGRTSLERRTAKGSVRNAAASTPGRAKRDANARFRTSSRKTIKLQIQTVGDPEQRAKSIIELRGVGPFLSGRYYVESVKHRIGGDGYTMVMACTRDGAGKLARRVTRARTSAGRKNTKRTRSKDTLVEKVDAETGAAVTYVRKE